MFYKRVRVHSSLITLEFFQLSKSYLDSFNIGQAARGSVKNI